MATKFPLERSVDAREQLIKKLRSQGYATYARILNLFDVYLTEDPNIVAYMIPNKATIVINKNLNIDQVSTIIRHEILHEYFNHQVRELDLLKKRNLNVSDQLAQLSNIAGDYDISNRGYTDADKITARAIVLGDRVLQGLVTEDQHPDWVDLSYEDMLDKLIDQLDKDKDSLQGELDKQNQMNNSQDLQDILDELQRQLGEGQNKAGDEKDQSSSDEGEEGQEQPSNETGDEEGGDQEQSSDEENSSSTSSQDSLDKAQNKLNKTQDDLNKIKKQEKGKDETPFDTPEEQKQKQSNISDLERRIKEIKDLIENAKVEDSLYKEVQRNKDKEQAAKEIKRRYAEAADPLNRFEIDLSNFIKKTVADERVDTWKRFSKKSYGTGIIKPGKVTRESGEVPVIAVYWDVSGSFDDPKKTEGARQAISLLDQYVRRGKIKTKTYYHANRVSDTIEGAGRSNDGQKLLDHIEATRPDNVIIISDDNIDGVDGFVEVPGAVWVLFYKTMAKQFMEHIKGERETEVYLID